MTGSKIDFVEIKKYSMISSYHSFVEELCLYMFMMIVKNSSSKKNFSYPIMIIKVSWIGFLQVFSFNILERETNSCSRIFMNALRLRGILVQYQYLPKNSIVHRYCNGKHVSSMEMFHIT